MTRWILLAAFVSAPLAAAFAQDTDGTGVPPQRIRNVQLVGDQPCPQAQGDEIVVCGRMEADELYRIPKQFREPPPSPANVAWANLAEAMMEDNRIGLPDSCSPVGTGGQTGCTAAFMNNYRAQMREQRRRDNLIP